MVGLEPGVEGAEVAVLEIPAVTVPRTARMVLVDPAAPVVAVAVVAVGVALLVGVLQVAVVVAAEAPEGGVLRVPRRAS